MKYSLRLSAAAHRLADGQSVRRVEPLLPKSLEQRRFGRFMSSRAGRAVFCVLALMAMGLSPLVTPVSAHASILLSVDVQHAVLEPGQSMNLTLTIENNASSIESYDVSVDDTNLASPWTCLLYTSDAADD